MDVKLAALADLSETLDSELPLSWSIGALAGGGGTDGAGAGFADTSRRPAASTPAVSLAQRLARKRHLAVAIAADAAMTAASPVPESGFRPRRSAAEAAAPASAGGAFSSEPAAQLETVPEVPTMSPPVPAAERMIADARRQAAGDDQRSLRAGGLWRRLLGGLNL